jgi:hypothetical protein
VWVQDLALDTGTEEGRAKLDLLRAVVAFEGQRHGDVTRLRVRRERAKPREKRKILGRPPWGTRGVGKAGKRKLAIRPDEYAVGKVVVEWRLKDYGWLEIHDHLKEHKVTKVMRGDGVTGRTRRQFWTVQQIKKAYAGMLRLMRWIDEGKIKAPGT